MLLQCGIVGLPNVGKSTLFNAITNTINAQAANYPFCTIEPNVGRVAIPDERLQKLAKIASSEKIIPNFIEIVDIAGLVAGASKGEGLGNQFLANIREVDAILHVVRCFNDDNIIHVANEVNPIKDLETIETELIIADVISLEKIISNLEKKAKSKDQTILDQISIAKKVYEHLSLNKKAISIDLNVEEKLMTKQFCLLTMKPILYVANVDEGSLDGNELTKALNEYISKEDKNAKMIIICSKLEADMTEFSNEEKVEMLQSLGSSLSGLDKLIQASYNILGLISFFTIGPKEAHAWNLKKGLTAPFAAGEIHTDFQKGFIKADTISYQDYIEYNGEEGAKNFGRLRQEGKEYIVQDGDIFHFKFNV
jgi:ribosome-binding ATPase